MYGNHYRINSTHEHVRPPLPIAHMNMSDLLCLLTGKTPMTFDTLNKLHSKTRGHCLNN